MISASKTTSSHNSLKILGPKDKKNVNFFKNIFLVCPFGYLYFLSFQLLNEPGLGAGIDPGMALTPLPSSIGWGSNPRPSDR